ELFVRMKYDLGVRVCGKPMPARLQFLAQFDVIENLAIINDPQRSVLITDRLLSRLQIDDAEARVSQRDLIAKINTKLIGTTMTDHRQHLPDHVSVNRFPFGQVKDASYATHQFSTVCWFSEPCFPVIHLSRLSSLQ